MPVFSYQCECGLQFERPGKASQAQVPHECSGCGGMAKRLPPESLGYTFSHEHTNEGVAPQNTGVSALDYDADRIVGEDARRRWDGYEKKEERRRELLRQYPGATKEDLAVLPNGDYRVMDPVQKKTTRNARAFHNLAAGLEKHRERYKLLGQASKASENG